MIKFSLNVDAMFFLLGQLGIAGRGCLLLAKVLRVKKDLKGESNAKEISDALPFIEYELHRQLLNKLKGQLISKCSFDVFQLTK